MSKNSLVPLLIYSLFASSWTARGKDDGATKAAKDANNVDSDVNAGNFIKQKLPDCKSLKDLTSYISAARVQWYNKTVPWGEIRNVRAGKVDDHMERMAWVGDIQSGMKPLLTAFEGEYAEAVERARFQLQDMFDEDDYPPVDIVASKFSFKVAVRPLTNTDDIRVLTDIPEAERQRLAGEIQRELEESLRESTQYALEKLHGPIANMAKQLQRYNEGETKTLHESLVANVIDMCSAASALNITNDATIDAFVKDAKKLISNVTKKDLKDSEGMRTDKAREAEALAKRMAAVFGG